MDMDGSLTAKLCLFARAVSSKEENPVFEDQIAGDLIGEKDYNRIAGIVNGENQKDERSSYDERKICRMVNCELAPILLPRQDYAEKKLRAFAASHQKIQYVILGAGMDTFAFRNQDENIEVYELDHPYTQNFKRRRIHELGWKAPGNVHYAPVDFSKDALDEVLEKAGYKKEIPSFFAMLGVTYYLKLAVLENMLRQIEKETMENDQIIFDYPDETSFTSPGYSRAKRLSEITSSLGETMTRGYSFSEIITVLARSGMHVKEHLSPQDIQSIWFHETNMHAFDNVHFLTAER